MTNNSSPVRPERAKGLYSFKKALIGFLVLTAAITGGVFYYQSAIMACGPIYDFDEARDTQSILSLFKKDYYWLVEGEYNPAAMLKYRAPSGNPLKKGQMHIKVLRDKDQFVGFVAYYKKSMSEWRLNFVALDDTFRGRGFAQQLMRYALCDMERMGAKRIELVTRTSNTAAQKLYNRVGFQETYRDEGYVYFNYAVK